MAVLDGEGSACGLSEEEAVEVQQLVIGLIQPQPGQVGGSPLSLTLDNATKSSYRKSLSGAAEWNGYQASIRVDVTVVASPLSVQGEPVAAQGLDKSSSGERTEPAKVNDAQMTLNG